MQENLKLEFYYYFLDDRIIIFMIFLKIVFLFFGILNYQLSWENILVDLR